MSGLSMRANVELPAPFKPGDLKEFFENVPDDARATVSVREGGTQRDPYPVAYLFSAAWESKP